MLYLCPRDAIAMVPMVVACSVCGSADERARQDDETPPLGWSSDLVETSEGTRTRWVCIECTRRYVRSIEAKLDREWW